MLTSIKENNHSNTRMDLRYISGDRFMFSHTLRSFFVIAGFFVSAFMVAAQNTIQCGSIVEGEFSEDRQAHEYTLALAPGDVLRVSGDRVGEYLRYDLDVTSPLGRHVIGRDYDQDFSGRPSGETSALSERGIYTVQLVSDGTGLYTIYVGCTLRDGTVIEPGDTPPNSQLIVPPVVQDQLPANFVGFRGLAPVDFTNATRLAIPAGVPMTGAITATGGEIFGYLVSGNEGDVVELQFTRLTGNLNLGIVVLSANNELAFQASLITSSTLTTRFTLPSTGEYTVGVFRVDLLPSAAPELTAFQIQAVVNP
jgi:hypothetical protein